MFDTKTNFLSYVDTKLWPFKSWRYQKIAKFWKAHNTPPRGPRAKKFWFSKFLPRGYLHAKNDQKRWDKGVKLLRSALEWAFMVLPRLRLWSFFHQYCLARWCVIIDTIFRKDYGKQLAMHVVLVNCKALSFSNLYLYSLEI